jgi:hypothetical protein
LTTIDDAVGGVIATVDYLDYGCGGNRVLLARDGFPDGGNLRAVTPSYVHAVPRTEDFEPLRDLGRPG